VWHALPEHSGKPGTSVGWLNSYTNTGASCPFCSCARGRSNERTHGTKCWRRRMRGGVERGGVRGAATERDHPLGPRRVRRKPKRYRCCRRRACNLWPILCPSQPPALVDPTTPRRLAEAFENLRLLRLSRLHVVQSLSPQHKERGGRMERENPQAHTQT